MERMYAVVEFKDGFLHDIICVCKSMVEADERCDKLGKRYPNYHYLSIPTFEVEEGEE